jgi:hypothetical protein
MIDRLGNEASDQESGAKTERDPDRSNKNGKPRGIGPRRGGSEAQEKKRTDRANARRNRPEQSTALERKGPAAGSKIGTPGAE